MRWWPWSKKQQSARQPVLMEGQNGYVFRRSRTLTGTTSPQVSASAEKRGLLKTERLKLHELRENRKQILKAAAGVLAGLGFVVYLAMVYIVAPPISFAQKGQATPNKAAYLETINSYFGTRPLERFGFATNADSMQDYLKRQHTEIKTVTMNRAWYGGQVSFTFYFREPLLTWATGGKKYYVDSQGFAFDYNHFAEPDVSVTDQSGISPEVGGGAVASGRFMSFLGRTVGAINQYGKGRVESIILPASTRQVDLKLEGRPTLIKTHIDRDPLEQAEDIANAFTYFDKQGSVPEYIDVRVSGKAFYR